MRQLFHLVRQPRQAEKSAKAGISGNILKSDSDPPPTVPSSLHPLASDTLFNVV